MHSLTSEAGFDHARLLEHQRLNHFPRHVELTRKHACGLPTRPHVFFVVWLCTLPALAAPEPRPVAGQPCRSAAPALSTAVCGALI